MFTGKSGTEEFLRLTENIGGGNELGTLMPLPNPELNDLWFLLFSFSEDGYIRDDDGNSLDADALLESIQDSNEISNKELRERGWGEIHILGWHRPPYYDDKTNNLTWAIHGWAPRDDEDVINHDIRILGRFGVTKAKLVAGSEHIIDSVAQVDKLIESFEYTAGNRYSDFVAGDRVASYGLTALIAGGAGAALAKTGLIKKFWKVIVIALIALGSVIKKLISTIFGQNSPDK